MLWWRISITWEFRLFLLPASVSIIVFWWYLSIKNHHFLVTLCLLCICEDFVSHSPSLNSQFLFLWNSFSFTSGPWFLFSCRMFFYYFPFSWSSISCWSFFLSFTTLFMIVIIFFAASPVLFVFMYNLCLVLNIWVPLLILCFQKPSSLPIAFYGALSTRLLHINLYLNCMLFFFTNAFIYSRPSLVSFLPTCFLPSCKTDTSFLSVCVCLLLPYLLRSPVSGFTNPWTSSDLS